MSNFQMLLILTSLVSCSGIKPIQRNGHNKDLVTKVKNLKEKKTKKLPVNSVKIQKFCKKLDKKFQTYNWSYSKCEMFKWKSVRTSHFGNPIMWTVLEGKNFTETSKTTLLMCGVHPDEITPVKFCFDILNDFLKDPQLYSESKIILAPIVTTDPFFFKRPTRTNSKKVDVNRNFPTSDWNESALKLWKKKYYSNKRRFPGHKSLTEQETIFQVNLIKLYKPDYIISVHAPLQLLDYDGPSLKSKSSIETKNILTQMSKKAGNYKIANYPFYPGSLGNWAGNERGIPTFTLELPNSDWNKTDKYFKVFSPAVYHLINAHKQ